MARISALRTQNFWIFAPNTPNFLRKTRSLDPTFGNPRGTYPPKKSWVPPPDPNAHTMSWMRCLILIKSWQSWYQTAVIFTCLSRLTNTPNNTMHCQLGAKSQCIGDKCLHQLSYGPEATPGTMRDKQYTATYRISQGRSQLVNDNCSTPWLFCCLQIRSENRHLMI